ncbi:Prolycopene isomerase, chloroplastic [Tetrabaena socialis]|uniref:Prolycopene isomerase, chloroplastic n=1 Tax=Tetrabaena socialis TaxID=47790 RepID=A0A2J8AK00_9CHLO|nr:Prolycopene isomerase, chloroplastic [Tetrabaena socialis]|eukprot:PNH12854.1 Prolycopene isomerase, chloroplastic [Tetrabaena socialis]
MCLQQRGLGGPGRAEVSRSCRLHASKAGATATANPSRTVLTGEARSHETDIVVVGSGIGGLSAAGLLAKYGHKVTVCESHSIPGGAAHAWVRDGYHFESGPSLYSGLSARGKEANPLSHVFSALGVELDLKRYNTWNVLVPEGTFLTKIGNDNFYEVLEKVRGPEAVAEWARLQEVMRPLAKAAALMPPAAFRYDPGVLITAFTRYLPALLASGGDAARLTGPFSAVLDGAGIKDPFVRNWLDLLSFLLSGLPANGTIAAEVVRGGGGGGS